MEYEPIYPAGFHQVELHEINKIFVSPYPSSSKRDFLSQKFSFFIDKFSELGINVEIWIDGSYSTHKIDPNDIDVLIIFDPIEVNKLSPEKQFILRELFDRKLSKIRYSLDILICEKNDENMRSYWRGWFGFSRKEKPKGIPRIYYGIN